MYKAGRAGPGRVFADSSENFDRIQNIGREHTLSTSGHSTDINWLVFNVSWLRI